MSPLSTRTLIVACAAAVDYLIDLHLPCGGIRRDWEIIEIIGDLSVRSVGEEMEG